MENKRVLITGASGFIATHIIKILLESGWRVRGTVRDAKKRDAVQSFFPGKRESLDLVEVDLLDPIEKWIPIVRDCGHVLHVASPMQKKDTNNADHAVRVAVEGTLTILKVVYLKTNSCTLKKYILF